MRVSREPPEVSREIHPEDGMWKPGESWYFRVGRSGLRAVELAIAGSWLEQPRSFLDLPSGYGRVARYLRAMIACGPGRRASATGGKGAGAPQAPPRSRKRLQVTERGGSAARPSRTC